MQGIIYKIEKSMFHSCKWMGDKAVIARTWPGCAQKSKYKELRENKLQNSKLCSICSLPVS